MKSEKNTERCPDTEPQFTYYPSQRLNVLKFAYAVASALLAGIGFLVVDGAAPSWVVAALGSFLVLSGLFFGLLDRQYHILIRTSESALPSPNPGAETSHLLESIAITGLYALITVAGLYFAIVPFFHPIPAVPVSGPGSGTTANRSALPRYTGYPVTTVRPTPNRSAAIRPPENAPGVIPPRPKFPPGMHPINPALSHPLQSPQTSRAMVPSNAAVPTPTSSPPPR